MADIKTNLLPPILEDYQLPQIVEPSSNVALNIEFYMPVYNEILEDKLPYVQIVIRDLFSNQSLYTNNKATGIISKFTYDKDTRKCIIANSNVSAYLTKAFNNVNTLFQIQLRFIDISDIEEITPCLSYYDWEQNHLEYFSEWSKVTIVKKIYNYQVNNWNYDGIEPNITLDNIIYIAKSPILNSQVEITPKYNYTNKNLIEYIDEYKFTLISMTSGEKDTSGWIKNTNKENWILNYNFKYLLLEGYYYIIKVDYKTINGYEGTFSSKVHAEFESTLGPNFIDFDSSKKYPLEMSAATLGHIKITAYWNNYVNEEDTNLSLVLYRSDITSKFTKWNKILNIKIPKGLIGETFSFYDKSIESGVWYRYAARLQTRDIGGYFSKTYFAENTSSEKYDTPDNYPVPIMCISEYIDLIGDNIMLPITLNAKVQSLSIKTADSTTETLGSQYPFVKRNGALKYKQFQFSGLISYHMDEYSLFMSEDEMYGDFIFLYNNYNDLYNINDYNNIIKEREYRKKVMDFLTNGKPKLFRSPTEGNMIIKLTNVSFTPNETLGRMIYDFSATAIEIAENSFENCIDLGILDIDINYNQPTIKILGMREKTDNNNELLRIQAETTDGQHEPVYGLDLLSDMGDGTYSIKATQKPESELDIIE